MSSSILARKIRIHGSSLTTIALAKVSTHQFIGGGFSPQTDMVIAGRAVCPSGGSEPPAFDVATMAETSHHDSYIPDFGVNATNVTVKDGDWADNTVWSSGTAPTMPSQIPTSTATAANDARVNHAVTISTTGVSARHVYVAEGASLTWSRSQNTSCYFGTIRCQ